MSNELLAPHDCHIHMVLDGLDWKAAIARHLEHPNVQWIASVLEAYAQSGTVYLREGGDRFGACLIAREMASDFGIEYASCAFPIYQKGNYGAFIGRSFESMAEFCSLVDETVERGGDYVKIMLSGIMDFENYGRVTGHSFECDELTQMINYSHSKGLAVMGHINGAQAVLDAVEAGIDSVEHGYYTDARTREALARSNTIWIPTLSPISNLIGRDNGQNKGKDSVLKRIEQDQMQAIAQVAQMGGIIALGSDAGAGGVLHVEAQRTEYELMHRALGDSCDRVLTRGLYEMRQRFPGKN